MALPLPADTPPTTTTTANPMTCGKLTTTQLPPCLNQGE